MNVIRQLWKHIEGATGRVKLNINCGLQLILRYQNWLITSNKCTTLTQGVNRRYVCMVGGSVMSTLISTHLSVILILVLQRVIV